MQVHLVRAVSIRSQTGTYAAADGMVPAASFEQTAEVQQSPAASGLEAQPSGAPVSGSSSSISVSDSLAELAEQLIAGMAHPSVPSSQFAVQSASQQQQPRSHGLPSAAAQTAVPAPGQLQARAQAGLEVHAQALQHMQSLSQAAVQAVSSAHAASLQTQQQMLQLLQGALLAREGAEGAPAAQAALMMQQLSQLAMQATSSGTDQPAAMQQQAQIALHAGAQASAPPLDSPASESAMLEQRKHSALSAVQRAVARSRADASTMVQLQQAGAARVSHASRAVSSVLLSTRMSSLCLPACVPIPPHALPHGQHG